MRFAVKALVAYPLQGHARIEPGAHAAVNRFFIGLKPLAFFARQTFGRKVDNFGGGH